MKQDYLWDGSGEPDPEIQELERLLAPLRSMRSVPEFDMQGETVRTKDFKARFARLAAFALAAMVLIAAGMWWFVRPSPVYEVIGLAGIPQVDTARVGEKGSLRIGQWLRTDASARARIQVGTIGRVDVDPNTQIQLLKAQTGQHRILLKRGRLHAVIWAPALSFFVDTPFAQAVDLGCAYSLEVDEDGSGLLRVTSGWVAFEHQGKESFVPAGASCRTHPESGPGIPYRGDASPVLRAALERIDGHDALTAEALLGLLPEVRKEDAFTLWHLLARADGENKALICDRLGQLAPMPQGVTRQGVLSGDARMLDLWWDQLGLGDAGWWRRWERPWQKSQ